MPKLQPFYIRGPLPLVKGTEHVPSGEQVIAQMRKHSSTISLSFSCGKDSIGAWLALHGKFKRIIPIYMYLIPDLGFVERALDYYEQFFNTRIYRVPHPSLYRMIRNYVYQPPERIALIDAMGLPVPEYEEITGAMIEEAGGDNATYCATGVRAADSPIRYMAVKKHGPINHKRRSFWPIWDWRKAYLLERMQDAGVKVPQDYRMFGRSFNGIDHRFMYQIKANYPEDYKKILKWFPLANLDGFRRRLGAAEKEAAEYTERNGYAQRPKQPRLRKPR